LFKESVGWQAKAFGLPRPLEQARVRVTFVVHSRRHVQDVDNLHARVKPLVDALQGIAIVDDSPRHVELEVRQQLNRERSVRIEVWPAGEPA
jgi:Holliday junction resolvase RusA-like endonuclease